MLYECDECKRALPPLVTECPACGEKFERAVPADAVVPKRGFVSKPDPVDVADSGMDAAALVGESAASVPDSFSLGTAQTTASRLDPKKILGLIGSVILFLGAFAPIVNIPIVGQMNYVENGRGDGMIIIAISVLAVVVTLMRRYNGLWFLGAGALGVLSFTYMDFQATLASTTSSLDADLANNPFKGLGDAMVQSVQIEWGFGVLILAAFLLIAAAAIPASAAYSVGERANGGRRLVAPIVSGILFLIIFASSYRYTQNQIAVAAAAAKAKADAAQAAADAEQEKEAAAQADKDNAVNQLELGKWGWASEDDGDLQYLEGTVYNGSDRTFSDVEITFDLLDSDGNKTGTAEDTVTGLAPGQTWKFKAMAMVQGDTRARFDQISGNAE